MEKLWVIFRLGSRECAFPVRQVKEIVWLGEVSRLPETPSFLEGLAHLRGRAIPVINLAKLLGVGEASLGTGRMLIMESRGRIVSLLVDGVREVMEIDRFDPPPVVDAENEFIVGIAKAGGRQFLLLDAERLFAGKGQLEPR